jgi:hypothetical protein
MGFLVASLRGSVEIDRDLSRKQDLSRKCVGFLALARLYSESWIFSVNFVLYGLGIVCLSPNRRKYPSLIRSWIFCMRWKYHL